MQLEKSNRQSKLQILLSKNVLVCLKTATKTQASKPVVWLVQHFLFLSSGCTAQEACRIKLAKHKQYASDECFIIDGAWLRKPLLK